MIACFLLTALSSSVCARDIFVDNVAGDDRRKGESPEINARAGGPCRSIRRALELAERADRVVIANTGQPYHESLTLQAGRHSGLPSRPFTIVGNGATLDGSAPVPRDAWEQVEGNIFRFRPRRATFQLLFLDGKPAPRRMVDRSQGFPELEPLEWCLLDRTVYLRVDKDRLPHQYDLSYTSLQVGITLYEVRHVLVTDLVVQGFQQDGVNAHDSAFDTTLVGLTCRGNGRSGISVGGASRVKIYASLVGNNGTAQVRTEGFSRTEIINCDLIDAAHAPATVREGGQLTIQNDAAGS
ncbi:MAG: hypothetical protein CMJ64_21540 [Planctomycetaceae bacterium]|nr:hypothetical protein [Planctomycetaceae bacterium]